MKNRKLIGGIYFDEVSEQVNDWLTIYLNFDDVDVSVKKLDSTLTLSISYRGRGSYILPSGGHASTSLYYTWTVTLLGVNTEEDLSDTKYSEVSVSINKTCYFNKKKIVIRSNVSDKVVTFYAKRVILENVTTEDVLAKKYAERDGLANPASLSFKTKEVDFKNTDTSIDKLGEEIVLNEETRFLVENGSSQYIKDIKWYPEYGDRKPYNIHSFFPNGEDKYIKVITTLESDNSYKIILNQEEIEFMEENEKNYFVYRLLSFNKADKTSKLEIYAGKDEINKRRLTNIKHEEIIQAFISLDWSFELANDPVETITKKDYVQLIEGNELIDSVQGLSERELFFFVKGMFHYEKQVGLLTRKTRVLEILDLPVIWKSDLFKSFMDDLEQINTNPRNETLHKKLKEKLESKLAVSNNLYKRFSAIKSTPVENIKIELIIGIAIGVWAGLGIILPILSIMLSQIIRVINFGFCW